MSREKSNPAPEEAPESSDTLLQTLRRGFITILIVGAILYGGALLLSTTDGFRKIQEDRLSEALQTPIQLGRCSYDFFLRLNLKNVSLGENTEFPVIHVQQAVLSYAWTDFLGQWGAIRAVECRGIDVNIRRTLPVSDAVKKVYAMWNPVAEPLGLYRESSLQGGLKIQIQQLDTEWLMDFSRVEIESFNFTERDVEGRILLDLRDASFLLHSLDIPQREYRYYQFSAEKIERPDRQFGAMDVEWILGAEGHVLLSDEGQDPSVVRVSREAFNRQDENPELRKNFMLDSESRSRRSTLPAQP